jgi:hypothetical protein
MIVVFAIIKGSSGASPYRWFPAFSAFPALTAFKSLDAGFSHARVLVLAAKTLFGCSLKNRRARQ